MCNISDCEIEQTSTAVMEEPDSEECMSEAESDAMNAEEQMCNLRHQQTRENDTGGERIRKMDSTPDQLDGLVDGGSSKNGSYPTPAGKR